MSALKLCLVRHGQASLHAEDYDQLSPLGAVQCHRLGQWLRAHGHHFEHVLFGTLKRHQQSFAALQEGYGEAMAPEPDDDLNEYDFRAILKAYLKHDPQAVGAVGGALLKLLKPAVQAWAEDQLEMPEHARFRAFADRVQRSRSRLQHLRGQALVITSGGPISLFTGQVLGLPKLIALELNLSYENSALSEFRFADERWSMLSFNAVPHLEPAERSKV
jgi:broad specificity phosphatase PhoE